MKDPKHHSNTTRPTVWSTGEAHSGTFKKAETEQKKVKQLEKNKNDIGQIALGKFER